MNFSKGFMLEKPLSTNGLDRILSAVWSVTEPLPGASVGNMTYSPISSYLIVSE